MTLTQCSLTNNFGGVAILLLDFVLQEGLSRPESIEGNAFIRKKIVFSIGHVKVSVSIRVDLFFLHIPYHPVPRIFLFV